MSVELAIQKAGGIHDGYNHPDHSGALAAWRAADVALQPKLGLLSERRSRAHPDNHFDFGSDGQVLTIRLAEPVSPRHKNSAFPYISVLAYRHRY
jgi:hypothetical protein